MTGQPPIRICIVMMSAVGDAVHVLPVINAIKRARPTSWITWVLQPAPAPLVRDHESVDEVTGNSICFSTCRSTSRLE